MPELQQYEVNVYPNCKESLYVTAEFPPYCRSNSVKDPSQAPVNQVASKPIFPHQLIPLPLKPSKPLNHKLALSSSGQCTPETNVASKPIVGIDSPRVSSSKKQRRIYSNLSDLKLSPSTASSSSPLFEFRNGIQYELAPIEYFDKTITPPPCSSPSPTTSGRTLSGPKKSFVTQVASKPIHPAQLCPRPLSSPPVVAAAPISGPVVAPAFAATGLPFAAGALGCAGRALSTPPPILPTVGIRDLYGVGGLPLRPSVGVSPFIGRGFNCGSPALSVPLGFPLNLGCHGSLSAPIGGLFPRTLGPICQQTVGAPLALPAPAISARTPLPIMPVPVQARCGVGAVPALPPCSAPCPRPCLPSCPPPCPPPRPLPCPPSNNIIIGGSDGRCDRKCSRQPECRGAVRLGKLCAGCCKKTQVFLGPPFIPQRRPFC